MSESWLKGETNKSRAAFEDYFLLGPGRSLPKLTKLYRTRTKPSPPTQQLRTLKEWSTTFDWQARVAERERAIAREQLEGLKKAARETGYAQIEQRLCDLNKIGALLFGEIFKEDKRWLPDVKQIGQGDNAERVDIVRFNAPLIQQYRETLNDIAAEMGQRVKGLELTGKDGGPIEVKDIEATRKKRWADIAPVLAGVETETDRTESHD